MADLLSQAIADASLKLRWREPYVTDGVNTAQLAHPAGAYRGFWIDQDTPGVTQAFRLVLGAPHYAGSDGGRVAGVDLESFAMHANPTTGYELAVRETAPITIDLAAAFVWPTVADLDLWIWIDADYVPNVATVANYVVSDADPRAGHPHAVVLGVIHLPAGSATIDFTGTSRLYYLPGSGGDRTWPAATPRETLDDYVAGDVPLGLMSGEDRWVLPTIDEKDALDGAPTAADAANCYVTEDDTTRKVFAEPTVVTVSVAAANNWVELDFATYGAIYVGRGVAGTGHRYLDVRRAGDHAAWQWRLAGQDARRITITNVCQLGGAVVINPGVEADAEGFYAAGVRVYFSETYGAWPLTTCDIWYSKRVTYATFNQAPALALATALVSRDGHTDTTQTRRAWAPPGCPLQADALAADALDSLVRKARGTNRMGGTEANLAAKLFAGAEAHPASTPCEETLGAVKWPRCFAYGYNDVGSADGGALSGGERFLLYTETMTPIALREQVVRRVINADGSLGTAAYLSAIVSEVHAGFPGIVAAESDWRIVSLASDGRYLYVRLQAASILPAGGSVHVVTCYDILNRTRRGGWPASGQHITTLAAIAIKWEDEKDNAMWVSVVDSTHIAVNEHWADLTGAPPDTGIEIRLMTTGAKVGFAGYGNALLGGGGWAETYAAGPMCSDGTNVYFTVRARNGGGINADLNKYAIAQATIADPSLYSMMASITEIDLSGWNPDPTTYRSRPRSLVYDGRYLWLSTRWGVAAADPIHLLIPPSANAQLMLFDHAATYEFGPMAFDGKYLWFGFCDADGASAPPSIYCDALYHMVRFNPANLAIEVATGTKIIGAWLLMLSRESMWALEGPLDPDDGAYATRDWATEEPFGDIIYDGDSVRWTKLHWDTTGGPPGTVGARGLILQRMANVHGI